MEPRLSQTIARVLQLDPEAAVLEFGRTWYRWRDLATTAAAVERHAGPGRRVGVLLRNRPAQVGLLVGLLRAGACVVVVNPGRGLDRVRAEVAALDLAMVAGEPADLDTFTTAASGQQLACEDLGAAITIVGEPEPDGGGDPGVAVEMLTSGTTGPPKRIPLTYETLDRVLAGAKYYESNKRPEPQLRSGVAIVNAPLVHLGGLFRVLQCITDGRSFCLLERFELDPWVDAVRRHRPATVSLVPAALRTVLEADLDPADLASLRSVFSGTAPLAPEDADAFTAKYGVPVLVSYAATEFGGGVAGWNLADRERFWASKRGSVGRPHTGCEVRVVAPDDGAVLGPDREGLLEVKTRQLGDDSGWQRTTDLARIDEDGFLWILGRADQAIIRGGFKIRPDEVRAALERDPRVHAAVVVGRPDARLGAVPVAAVELRAASGPVAPEAIVASASTRLAPYELPVELRIVDELPRTPSGKIDLAAVRQTFGDAQSEAEET
jgi:acyl-CoA synthetase (AMP-forming)/AMP-acid ligase II